MYIYIYVYIYIYIYNEILSEILYWKYCHFIVKYIFQLRFRRDI